MLYQYKKFRIMEIRTFKNAGVRNGWEINFIGKVYNLRIARHQIAFWINDNPLINWVG